MSDSIIAEADQRRAAEADSGRLLEVLGRTMDRRELEAMPGWADRIISERAELLAAGDPGVTACRHAASPAPLLMPAWAPVVVCHACAARMPRPTSADDETCDSCGAIGPVRPVVVGVPPVTVVGGLCPACSRGHKGRTS